MSRTLSDDSGAPITATHSITATRLVRAAVTTRAATSLAMASPAMRPAMATRMNGIGLGGGSQTTWPVMSTRVPACSIGSAHRAMITRSWDASPVGGVSEPIQWARWSCQRTTGSLAFRRHTGSVLPGGFGVGVTVMAGSVMAGSFMAGDGDRVFSNAPDGPMRR
jgi:hypothetical protein